MKSFMKLQNDKKVLETFKICQDIVLYNYGEYHPLHASNHSAMAAYKFGRGDFNLALRHYRTALEDCLRILGVDHPLTGQMYLDIANVFLRMERREEAIRFLEKAFEIFDTAKHVSLRFFILF